MKIDTTEQILDVAQGLVCNRGYSGFSYADISEQIDIRKASIHYHFACKTDLIKTLIHRYRESSRQLRAKITASTPSPDQQLIQFANLYRDGLQHGQLCLCGMLASDFVMLPDTVQTEIRIFISENEAWLVTVLAQGCHKGVLRCRSLIKLEAKRVLATLQGAQLIARTFDNSIYTFEQMIQPLLSDLLVES